MAKDVIGHIKCGYCGYDEAEVKETKRVFQGKPFVMVWCPHPKCLSQHFPRGKDASEAIRAKMRPVGEPSPETVKNEPAADPAPAKPAKKSFAEEMGF